MPGSSGLALVNRLLELANLQSATQERIERNCEVADLEKVQTHLGLKLHPWVPCLEK